ncbi:HEAT repeat domain-containing protein [Marispirochaeta sp.]|jgi:HEAT repeat protein|uniref:HEAT repeat domain-containing protein n=1 Tax=Marispirochaeta sp. TaxID=2038653 RepID=UPI0029C7FC84|nr:HEAT repeat domain-containing protein [Marispirochaeta sp.]
MNISGLLGSLPLWIYIVDAILIAGIVAALIWTFISHSVFKKRLEKAAVDEEAARELILEKYDTSALIRRSRLIEAGADKYGDSLLKNLSMDEIWVNLLRRRKRVTDIRRVLKFIPERGLFYVFLAVLDKPRKVRYLTDWLKESGDLLAMRRIALSGKGENFDGQTALEIFEEYIPHIREMTGDPEWASRYFAVKILLHHDDDRSQRAVWDCLHDTHALVRRTVATELTTDKKDELFEALKTLFIDDPVFEVRRAAKERINLDFPDREVLNIKKMNDVEAFHVLDLMNPEFAQDENTALSFLDHDNNELRLSAAYFLNRLGTLDRLFQQVELGDRELFERNFKLLTKAAEVGISDFLKSVSSTKNPATLLMAARLLQRTGSRELINSLAKNVFALTDEEKTHADQRKLYDETLKAIKSRGTCDAVQFICQELEKHSHQGDFLDRILPALPESGDFLIAPLLVSMLKDPEVPRRDLIRETIFRFNECFYQGEIIGILKAEREEYPHQVRIDALKLLAQLKKPYCLQHVLENLSILPLDEARYFTSILADFSGALFNKRVEGIMASDDAHVRASLIAALPATGIKDFIAPIRKALKDADPEVRMAAVWALHDYQEQRALNGTVEMLRDPVERVRVQVAKALGSHGTEGVLDRLKELLFDENEVPTVKIAAIAGLSFSETRGSVDVLVEKLRDMTGELREEIIQALAEKHDQRSLTRMVEVFKDSEPKIRESMSEAFKRMRSKGETSLVNLLNEDIPSLLPLVYDILEDTGWVESIIRRLAKRDPKERREAAALLARIGTRAAFRGIVLAARDPDEEVRVEVTKALEYLNTPEGAEILADLENDPDKRVRKYTLWALERIKAKNLD